MKFRFLGLVAILAAICLICSCGNGSGDSENAAPKTVALSFVVNTDDGALRALAVTNPAITVVKYQYKATAKFSTEFGTPQGDTGGAFVDFASSTATGGEAGMFAQGKWEFEIQGLDAETNGAVVCKTAAPLVTYVNASTTSIDVFVVRQFASGTGTLIINGVTAPTYSQFVAAADATETTPAVEAKCDKLEITGGPATYTIDATTDADGKLSTFTKTFTEVAAGIYTMTFTVKDSAGNAVGSTVKIVEIVNGKETTVTGNIDSGKWLTESFKVAEKTITLAVSASATDIAKAEGAKITFTFTGSIKEGDTVTDEKVKYFFSDGNTVTPITIAENATAPYTYDWVIGTTVAEGYYYPCIIASDEGETLKTEGATAIKVTVHEAGWTATSTSGSGN